MNSIRTSCIIAGLFALVLSAPLAAQQRWEPANNGLDAGNVRTFGFSARGDVYAGGADGIYRLVGGDHWEMLHRNLQALTFLTCPDGTMVMAGVSTAIRSEVWNAVYRSSDNGTTWEMMLDSLDRNGLQIAPDGTLYLPLRVGLLRSLDMGRSWQRLATPRDNEVSQFTNGLMVIEKSGALIYSRGDSSTYLSTDRGESWSLTGSQLPVYYYTYALTLLPDGRLCAMGPNYESIWVSADQGRTWQVGDSMMLGSWLRLPDGEHLLYYKDWNHRWGVAGHFRSSDTGRSWHQVDGQMNQTQAVAPDGTMWRSVTPYCYRSADGGQSWENVTAGMDYIRSGSLVADTAGNMYLTRIDQILEDRGDPFYREESFALFRSQDNGSSWQRVSDSLTWKIAIDDSGRLYATRILPEDQIPGNYSLVRTQVVSRDGGRSWQRLGVDVFGNVTVQRSGVVTALTRDTSNTILEFVISLDGGTTWKRRSTPFNMGGYHRTLSGVIIAHFARFDIPDTGHGIYRSLDDGETWEPVITGTGRNTFLFSSDTHGTIYFAGNPRGDGQDKVWKPIYRSTDNGATFEKTVDSVRIWAFTPAADGKMYIYAPIDSTGLTVRSSDRGATWEQLPLPAIRGDYNSLFTEGADGMLYWSTAHYSDPYYPPATVVRLHRAVDGRNWEPFDEGLPRVGITGFLDMPGRPLFVATERGIYRMDRRSAAPLPVAEHGFAFDITPNPLDDHGDIIIDLASREHLRVTLHDMLGRTISTLADDEREAGRSTIVIATEELAAGSYIIRASVGGRTASRVVIVR